MFKVELRLHLTYDKGTTTFVREDELPFVPFIGLDVLDNALGQFTIEHVAWFSKGELLICQSQEERRSWTIRTACRNMKEDGWEEEKESRMRS